MDETEVIVDVDFDDEKQLVLLEFTPECLKTAVMKIPIETIDQLRAKSAKVIEPHPSAGDPVDVAVFSGTPLADMGVAMIERNDGERFKSVRVIAYPNPYGVESE